MVSQNAILYQGIEAMKKEKEIKNHERRLVKNHI